MCVFERTLGRTVVYSKNTFWREALVTMAIYKNTAIHKIQDEGVGDAFGVCDRSFL